MANIDEQILRATKEIIVKFIETGRISPSGFNETFKNVYRTVDKTTRDSIRQARQDEPPAHDEKNQPARKNKKKE